MTKKKLLLIILVALIILCIIGLILKLTIFNKWIKNSDYLYDKAIEAIILEESKTSPDKNVSGFHTFATSHNFGIQKGTNSDEKIVYIWINYQSYYVESDQIWKSTGSSHPYKFTFIKDEVAKYEIPSTHDSYQKEIKKLFPEKIAEEIINYNSIENIDKMAKDIKSQVDNYEEYQSIINKNNK